MIDAKGFILAAVAAAGLASVVGAADGARSSCDSRRSTTLLRDRQIRVYEHRHDLYVCRYSNGTRADLVSRRFAEEHWYPKPAIKIRGTVVAFAVTGPGVGSEADDATTVDRVDIRDPREPGYLRDRGAFAGPRVSKVGSLVLRADGAMAWIACPGGLRSRGDFKPTCDDPGYRDRVYTLTSDATKRKLVGSGTRIDPQSLRQHGSRITWIQHGHRRSARLPRRVGR